MSGDTGLPRAEAESPPALARAGGEWPLVTVAVPMRDEESSLAACLEAIRAQDYPAERLEVYVVDGGSTDASPGIVRSVQAEDPRFRCLENPSGLVSRALNQVLRVAQGRVLLRIDAHTLVAPDYVRRCVERLAESGAQNVGGPMEPEGRSPWSRAIAAAMRSRFGVGPARFRYARRVEPVDTVYLGAFPIELFGRVGDFNEEMVRNQDYEMNYRIRRSGGTILADPAIRSTYLVRPDLPALWRQFESYGYWKLQMLRRHPGSLRPRQLAAPLLVAGSAFAALVSIAGFLSSTGGFWTRAAFPLVVGGYVVASAAAAAASVGRRGATAGAAVRLPAVFSVMHCAWGLGFWRGLLRPPGSAIGDVSR
ncbi:MAG: glycosyltransferase family 2 protein [Thermoanaerobaculia bacterium]